MKKSLQGKLTYANVVSTLCLFLLVGGGTAFAASQLAKNSVGTKQLKKGAVTTAKIAKRAQAALVGSQGPKGEQGPPGAPGAPATALYAQIKEDGTVNASGSPVTVKHLSEGNYIINFGREITRCGAVANQGGVPLSGPGSSTPAAEGFGVRVNMSSALPPGGEPQPGFPLQNSVSITTFSSAVATDSSFYIAVLC